MIENQKHKKVKPYDGHSGSKKEQVGEMFDNISSKYDFLNHFLSLGIDKRWRKKVLDILLKRNPQKILDLATGTGDLAIALSEIEDAKITGIDISEKMLNEGRQKLRSAGLENKIELFKGDAEKMLFPNNTFDAVSVAFGVRNFENLEAGISEIKRVLKPGGTCVILEFAQPQKFPVKQVYHLYFNFVCPFWGRLIAGDDRAYKYLAESVYSFPFNEQFLNILKTAGFRNCHYVPLTFGIASIYVAEK